MVPCFFFFNFYHRFICDFSKKAIPLTRPTSPKIFFQWDQLAQAAFNQLKQWFAWAPILAQTDLNLQFIVDVGASDTGIGAVLSQ